MYNKAEGFICLINPVSPGTGKSLNDLPRKVQVLMKLWGTWGKGAAWKSHRTPARGQGTGENPKSETSPQRQHLLLLSCAQGQDGSYSIKSSKPGTSNALSPFHRRAFYVLWEYSLKWELSSDLNRPLHGLLPLTDTMSPWCFWRHILHRLNGKMETFKTQVMGFPGGAVVEGLPANAGDTGSSPGLGGSHMPQSNWVREPQLLSLRVWSLFSATREAATVRGPRTAMKSGPHLPQLQKALAQKRRPNTAKNK